VSSNYHLLCLSHDPAIVIDCDFRLDEVEAVTREHEAPAGHQDCDIVAGRFSCPLIEAGCFGRTLRGPSGCKGIHHRGPIWTDSNVLRLLHYAAPSVDQETLRPFVTGCWPLERLRRLRRELGIEATREHP
jgi:hypothetical protein